MRYWLIDLPAFLFDRLLLVYVAFLGGLGIACLITAALWYLASLAGLRLP